MAHCKTHPRTCRLSSGHGCAQRAACAHRHRPAELRERLQGLSEAACIGACVRLLPAGATRSVQSWRSRFGRSRSRVRQLRAESQARQSSPAVCRHSPSSCSPVAESVRSGQRPCSSPGLRLAPALGGGLRPSCRDGTDPSSSGEGRALPARPRRDRRLNRAPHTIVLSLGRVDAETKAYIARRLGEGKNERETVGRLKRYLTCLLYRLLEAMPKA